MSVLADIFEELFNLKKRVALSLVLGIFTVAAGVGLLAASGYLITWAALRPPILDLILVLVAVRFFGISRAAFRYAERLFSHDLTFRILKNLRVRFYEKIEPLLPAKAIRYRSADLLSRFSDDVDQLQEFYLKTIAPAIAGLFFIGLTALVTSIYSPLLAVTIVALMLFNSLIMPVFIRHKAGRSAEQLSRSNAELSDYMNDHILGATDRLFSGSYEEWIRKGERLIDTQAAIQQKRAGALSLESGLYTLLSHASLPVSFLLLLPLILDGTISGLVMTALVLGIFSAFEALEPMGRALQHYYESKEAAGRLTEITSGDETGSKPAEQAEFTPGDYSVTFRDVCFGYTDEQVIKNLNLKIRSGEHLLLKGPSGCGKSTLVHLLVQWFKPDSGEISIGGVDINTCDPKSVRTQIAVVGQHTRLFNTTLRNNLKIAAPGATDDELIDALKKAGFAGTLKKLPDGLDTQVGELGLRLSGGERQRVSLARALLKDAPIWILDEPLSSLDREMADEIMQTLQGLITDKTVLHITHQSGKHLYADRIFHMTNGTVCEEAGELV